MFSRHLDICNLCGGGIIFNAIATLLRHTFIQSMLKFVDFKCQSIYLFWR